MPYVKKNIPSGPEAFSGSYYIDKFTEIYGDRYIYFLDDFSKRQIGTKNRDLKIRIQCIHGIREINVRKHLQGYECRYCKGTMIDKSIKIDKVYKQRRLPSSGSNIKGTRESFIGKSQAVHGDRYDYTNFEYRGCKTKGKIRCYFHGDFMQTPDAHINARSGCPHCGSGGTYSEWYFEKNPESKNMNGIIYVIEMRNDEEVFLKIGVTEKGVEKRFGSPSKNRGYKTRIILQRDMSIYDAWKLEQKILSDFKSAKYIPLVYFPGHTECLNKSNEAMILKGLL